MEIQRLTARPTLCRGEDGVKGSACIARTHHASGLAPFFRGTGSQHAGILRQVPKQRRKLVDVWVGQCMEFSAILFDNFDDVNKHTAMM